MDAQCCDDGAQSAGVEFGTAVPGPTVGQVGPGAVDGFGDVAQVLLGVVDVNDLEKLLGGDVPNTQRRRDDDPAAVSKPRRCASRHVGRRRPAVGRCRGWPRSRPRPERPAVAHGPALCVAPFGRRWPGGSWPNRPAACHRGLRPRLGAPARRCRPAPGSSARGWGRFRSSAAPIQGLLDLLGLDARGQFPQQEAGVGGRQPHQPQHAGRQRRGVHTQGPVARTHPRTADVQRSSVSGPSSVMKVFGRRPAKRALRRRRKPRSNPNIVPGQRLRARSRRRRRGSRASSCAAARRGPSSAATSAANAATNAAPKPSSRPGSPWRALDELSARGSRPAHSRSPV